MKKQQISIVTVSYNAGLVIEKTIKSIIAQNYDNIQYLIIDGGSNDSTLSVIKRYKAYISYFVSEPDKGIYDAMNKAIKVATGEWIIFMNAGDLLIDGVLNKIFVKEIDGLIDVVYGDTIIKYPFGNRYIKAGFFANNDMNLPFCHQSAIVRTKYMKQYRFDLGYKIAADYNFFYTLYKEGRKFLHVPIPIAQYDAIGFSTSRVLETYKEVCSINGRNHGFKYYLVYGGLILRRAIMDFIPDSCFTFYRKLKYRNE